MPRWWRTAAAVTPRWWRFAVALALLATVTPAPAASAVDCPEPPAAIRETIRQTVLAWGIARYPELLQDVRIGRVCGDWALVILLPKERINPAAVVVQFNGQSWQVVAGPGTAFPPEARPAGAPAALFGDDPDASPNRPPLVPGGGAGGDT